MRVTADQQLSCAAGEQAVREVDKQETGPGTVSLAGSRGRAPGGVQGQSPWWGPGAKPNGVYLRIGTYFYRFNCAQPPFDDVRVRKAFSLAIDRRIITKHVLKGGQVPATWFCPDVAGYHHVDGLACDPAAARKLLADAGYGPGGKPFPPTEILFNTSDAHRQVAEAVVQQWHDQLGVTISLRNGEWKSYLDDMEHQHYQIMRSSWIGDYGDPNTFFDLWVKNGGNNHTGWSSPDYDKLLTDSQAEADPAKRRDDLQKLEHILVEDQFPIMPLYIYVQQGLLRDKVRGVHGNVRDIHPFQYLWIDGG